MQRKTGWIAAAVLVWAAGCGEDREFNGDLTIATSSDLEEATGYTAIRGDLVITVDGLERLALPRLERVDGLLQVSGGVAELSLPALEAAGLVSIAGNPSLVSVALPALDSTTGFALVDNPELASLAVFASPAGVQGDLTITANRRLLTLAGLDGLVAVDGTVEIGANERLRDLDGLESLGYVGDTVSVIDNPALEDLGGLAGLESASHLVLANNPRLSRLADWRLASLGSLTLADLPALADLDGFAAVRAIEEELSVRGVTGFSDLATLGSLSSLGVLRLESESLRSIGLDAVTEIEVIEAYGCAALQRLDLAALERIIDSLVVTTSPELERLDLPAIRQLGLLVAHQNPKLPTCHLEALVAGLDDPDIATVINENSASCPEP